MRISCTEPSSVIHRQTNKFKNLNSYAQNNLGKLEPKGMMQYDNQPKFIIELGYMCPRGLSGSPAVTHTE